MKQLLVKFVYGILDFIFPEWFSEKIKMTGCIWTGDWHFLMPCHPVLPMKKIPELHEERVREVYNGLPECELNSILAYLRKADQYSHFPYPESGLLFNYKTIMKDKYEDHLLMQKEIRREVTNFGLKSSSHNFMSSEEVFFFHHGLRFMDKEAKAYIRGKIIIDAGAYLGDSALVFAKYYSPGKICSFEPSERNREQYLHFMKKNRVAENIYTLYPFGLGAEEKEVRFNDDGTAGCTLGDSVKKAGKNFPVISVKTVDQIFADSEEKVGLIKADVEGMCLDLVKGAEQVIRRDLPVLSLSIYHNQEELLEVYPYLKSLRLDYEYHFQLLRPIKAMELVLIAYPQKSNR